MRHLQRLVLGVALWCCIAVGAPTLKNTPSPYLWSAVAKPEPSHTIHLTVALKQHNIGDLQNVLAKVSDPRSDSYGLYLSLEDVADIVAPPAEDIAVVRKWFEVHGAKVTVTRSRDFLKVDIPVAKLESALGVTFRIFEHVKSGRRILRTAEAISIPDDVANLIDVITGLNDFMQMPSDKKAVRAKSNAGTTTSAPEISTPKGGSTDIYVSAKIYCKNGAAMQSGSTPCTDGSVPKQVELRVTPFGSASPVTQTVSTITCGSSSCAAAAHFTGLPAYVRADLRARTTFSDGTVTDWGVYPTTFAPTSFITPQKIYEMYHVPAGLKASNGSQSVVAFEEQYYSDTDLASYFELLGLEAYTPTIVGTNDFSKPGGEATLDIEYIMGVGYGIPTTFWSVSGDPLQGGFILEWAQEIAADPNPPLVTSISYGDTEMAYYNAFGGWDYIYRMESELLKMGVRGLTTIAGSGDAGCSNVGEAGNDLSPPIPTCTPLNPFYPSDSAYVVSVSSTFLTTNSMPVCYHNLSNNGMIPIFCDQVGEVAVGVSQGVFWTTGGGFSNLTAVQSWQQTDVDNYLSLYKDSLPPTDIWNINGRGFPDISALGLNLICVLGGQIVPIGGTSASGPVIAGLIALLNDARLNAGKPSMGFINPWLYQVHATHPEAFNDVTVGINNDGDVQARGSQYPTYCPYGFSCKPGWDAVTGLGTPNWGMLKELALQ